MPCAYSRSFVRSRRKMQNYRRQKLLLMIRKKRKIQKIKRLPRIKTNRQKQKRLQRQMHRSLHSHPHPVQNQRLQQASPMAQVPDRIANSLEKAIMEAIVNSNHRTRMYSMAETVMRISSRSRHLKRVPENAVFMDR